MQIEVGAVLEGKVTGITNFGAFVDLDSNTSGMVHISEVSTSFVNDINEFLKVGDTVKVKVMGVNEKGKISLSIRREMENNERPERKPKGEFRPKNDRPFNNRERSNEPQKPKTESNSFEDMMARFKQSSDEKFMDLKRKNGEVKRNRRAAKQ